MGINRQRPEKKLRGIPRRLRSLESWSESFREHFPPKAEVFANGKYWNFKVPTDWAMLEGKQSTTDMKRQAAQHLVNACGYLIAKKPDWARQIRVTCLVALPDMFTSKLCIYLDEDYYRSKVEAASNEHGRQTPIEGRSLVSHWSLSLPKGVGERGVLLRYNTSPNMEDHYVSEHWMYGDVQ